jgi:PAS domain S-box-containing protein
MSLNSAYIYVNTKDKIIKDMKNNSEIIILSINDNIKDMIASYSVNEYNNLILNEINHRDIFAIIINDYNMGKIIGEKALVSGKIKIKNKKTDNYIINNKEHNQALEDCFYSNTYNITSTKGEALGSISIYITDESMNKELKSIIISNLQNSIIISITLIFFLFITIQTFILKPISDIVETIKQRDKDGIPIKSISNNPLIEMNILSTSINDMINSIRKSRTILKKEQDQLEYLLELSPIAVRIAKNKGEEVIFANNAYSKLLKVENQNTTYKNPKDYYDNQMVYNSIIQRLENNEIIYNELIELNIQSKIRWVLASYMNINFDGEKAIIGWFYDVSNEKNNENKLFEALELQTTIFDNSGYLIIRTDKEGIIQQMNKEAIQLLGYKNEEVIGKMSPATFHLKSEVEQRAKEFSKELQMDISPGFNVFVIKSKLNMTNEYEWIYVSKEGKHVPVFLSVTALKNKNNEIYGYLGVARDISQSKLIQSQAKLASMGEMIGNIAHQWRQPLSVISTIASGIKIKSEFNLLKEDELLHDMSNITEQTQYLSKTIDDFRNFINNNNNKENIYISNLIEKTMSILRSSIHNNDITVILDIQEDGIINGFENQLIQALINIINNSKDAVNEHIKEGKDKYIFIQTHKVDKNLVLIIKDNGGGIKQDVIDKIFDPYFTTKHKSKGTGIGLSMSYQIIIEHHDATISVANETYTYNKKEYTGAHFDITFLS